MSALDNPLSMFDVKGKVALITGASGAFGAVAARAINQLCVTLASMTFSNVCASMSVIFATLFMPLATTRMSSRPKASTAPATKAAQASSLSGRATI